MIVAMVCYKRGVPFDEDYYFNKHVPLAAEMLPALGLKRAEIRKVVGTADGSPEPYQVVASLYFDSMEAFQATTQTPQFKEVVDDIQAFYKGNPDIWVTQVAAAVTF